MNWLIVGLGNPGATYARQRHNIGFMFLDRWHAAADLVPWKKRHDALVCEGRSGDNKYVFLKPQTFMNLSGQAVQKALQHYRLKPEQMLVVHDDLDLSLGKIRIKQAGGNGGHNGLRSIDQAIGPDYWRLRIGISRPEDKNMVSDYVLRDFDAEQQLVIDDILKKLVAQRSQLLAGEFAKVMTNLNSAVIPTKVGIQ